MEELKSIIDQYEEGLSSEDEMWHKIIDLGLVRLNDLGLNESDNEKNVPA